MANRSGPQFFHLAWPAWALHGCYSPIGDHLERKVSTCHVGFGSPERRVSADATEQGEAFRPTVFCACRLLLLWRYCWLSWCGSQSCPYRP